MFKLRILYGKASFSVDVEPNDTILGVKTKIGHEVKAQALRLRLTCNENTLVNSSTVGEYGLSNECTVHCTIDATMTIHIKEVDGNRIPIMVESTTTGLQLKHELLTNQDKYFKSKGYKELKVYMQKHYYAGAELQQFKTLSEQRVFNESTVDFFFMRKSKMTLTIDNYTGQQLVLPNLNSDTSIWQLKNLLSKQYGIKFDKQILVFNGQLLEHGSNVVTSSYRLYDGAKLNLLQGLKQGIINVTVNVIPLQIIVEFEVDRSNTIGELKTMIEESLSGRGEEISRDVQVLFFPLSRFEDNQKTLAEYYITNGSVINMVYSKMRISVNVLGGYKSKFWIIGSDYIKDLKNLIHEKEGFHPNTQQLLMDGRVLHDKNTMDWYKIRSEFILDLTLVKP
ncbi:hypothetical protein CTI12_AA151010 [Artemisia annua]|uniref:Ubiquitin-like domain-containing protein n=1 Tax=Artemisia annua TaxID=35608 RepID=A0A2U1PHN0_ARTAN|nr:hypothetical protein CTI12_AA151010 [Artemisia annua]